MSIFIIIGGILLYLFIGALLLTLASKIFKLDTNGSENAFALIWPVVLGLGILIGIIFGFRWVLNRIFAKR